jgi:Tol biopolymer transport system component
MARKSAFLCVIFLFLITAIALPTSSSFAAGKVHKVAWQQMVDKEFQVFLMDYPNPASVNQITRGKYGSKHPSLTSNANRIYYYRWTPTNWGDMDLMYYQDMSEKKERQVQRNAVHQEEDPCVSRNGSTLAYKSLQSVTTETATIPDTDNWEIVCLKTDFSEARKITNTQNDDSNPFLNGSGDKVYFDITVERDRTETEKQAMRDAEKEKHKVKPKADTEKSTTESLSFLQCLNESPSVMNVEFWLYPGMGGGSAPKPAPSKTEDKDGKDDEKGADSGLDEESWEFNHFNVYYIFRNSFDGKNLERVTPRDYNAWHPSVDAKENWMVFVSDMDGNDEIYLMNLNSFEIKRLTDDKAKDSSPQISSDGEIIVFVSDRDGDKEIFSMKRDGSDLVQLTDNVIEDDNPSIT